jgi:hypothetical protein
MVASDGGIFAFGDATFYGSLGGTQLDAPVVGIALDSNTNGYWIVTATGSADAFDVTEFSPATLSN